MSHQNSGFTPLLGMPEFQVSDLFTFDLQVLEFLSNPDDGSRHEEREQAVLELLHAGGLQQFEEEKLLTLSENAKL